MKKKFDIIIHFFLKINNFISFKYSNFLMIMISGKCIFIIYNLDN